MEKHKHFTVQLFGDNRNSLVFLGHTLRECIDWIKKNAVRSDPDVEDEILRICEVNEQGELGRDVLSLIGWDFETDSDFLADL